MTTPKFHFKQVTIDCCEPKALSDFYAELLGWEREYVSEKFVRIASGVANIGFGFQRNEDYVPPVWPDEPGKQQQMEHLDIYIDSLEEMPAAVDRAIALGATKAPEQYSKNWTVMLDPEGHPFCIDLL